MNVNAGPVEAPATIRYNHQGEYKKASNLGLNYTSPPV